jgi:hypothetical protein
MKRAPMPTSVKVGPHTYTVLSKTRAQMPLIDGEKSNGYYDRDALEIGLLRGMRLSKTQENLLHEALHAIWPSGYGFEEEIILELTPRLLELIRQNPALTDFLTASR